VRTIGDPGGRFKEDPIRILRAIKFAARLDFEIEPKTLAALKQTRSEIPKAAAPRILEEFNRFCRSGSGRRSFELAFDTGVFDVILPSCRARMQRTARAQGSPDSSRRDRRALEGGRDVYPGEIFSALLVRLGRAGAGIGSARARGEAGRARRAHVVGRRAAARSRCACASRARIRSTRDRRWRRSSAWCR
jgi:hypothetical protein